MVYLLTRQNGKNGRESISAAKGHQIGPVSTPCFYPVFFLMTAAHIVDARAPIPRTNRFRIFIRNRCPWCDIMRALTRAKIRQRTSRHDAPANIVMLKGYTNDDVTSYKSNGIPRCQYEKFNRFINLGYEKSETRHRSTWRVNSNVAAARNFQTPHQCTFRSAADSPLRVPWVTYAPAVSTRVQNEPQFFVYIIYF